MSKSNHTYLPNLHGLRAIAALVVIGSHIPQYRAWMDIPNKDTFYPFNLMHGQLAVIFFFVLSGFLITHLLLLEEKQNSKINILAFYKRRILKIWPLYFLIIGIGLFILPKLEVFYLPKLSFPHDVSILNLIIYYLLFLPHVLAQKYNTIPFLSHLWSLGIEEYFYLVWPFFLIFVKNNRVVKLSIIIVFYFLFQKFCLSNWVSFLPGGAIWSLFFKQLYMECMFIGALFAFLYYYKEYWKDILLNTKIFYLIFTILLLFLILNLNFHYIQQLVYSALFGFLILNLACNNTLRISLENRVLTYLGKISYGIYMFHTLAVFIILKLFPELQNLFIFGLACLLSIALSSLSYYSYESYFRNLKLATK